MKKLCALIVALAVLLTPGGIAQAGVVVADTGATVPVTSDLVLWLKADTITGLGDGDFLIDWADSAGTGSGIGDDTSQDATLSDGNPQYYTRRANGMPVVQFGGGGAYGFAGPLGISGQAEFTAFIVGDYAGTGGNHRALNFGEIDADPGGTSIGLDIKSAGFRFNNGNRLFAESFDDTFRIGTWQMTTTSTYGTAAYWLDGSPGTETGTTNPDNTINLADEGYYVGRGVSTAGNPSDWYTGDLAEVLLYKRALTTEEIDAVGAYLELKYGLDTTFAPDATLISQQTGDWNDDVDPRTWDTTDLAILIPTALSEVLVDEGHTVTIQTGAAPGLAGTLEIIDSGKLVIGADQSLTVTGAVDGSNLELADNAILAAGGISQVESLVASGASASVSTAGQMTLKDYSDNGGATTLTLKGGGGVYTLENASTVAGSGFTVEGSTLEVGGASPLGAAQTLTLNNGTVSITSAGVLDNPIGKWDFEGVTPPTVPNVVSPGVLDGTMDGDATIAVGQSFNLSDALSLDGIDDDVNFGDVEQMDAPGAFTASIWFRRDGETLDATNHGVNNVLMGQSSNADNDNFELGTEGDLVELYLDTGAGAEDSMVTATVPGGITNGTWHHVAVTYNEDATAELKVYFNGALIQEWDQFNGPLISSLTSPLALGIARPGDGPDNGDWGELWGMMDNVRLFDRPLPATEIAALAAEAGGLAAYVAPDVSSVNVVVDGDSTIDAQAVGGLAFAGLTLKEGLLRTRGLGGVSFTGGTTIHADATAVGIDPRVDTDYGGIDGSATAQKFVFAKAGPADVTMQPGSTNGMGNATFRVEEGTLRMVDAAAWGGATSAELAGGMMVIETTATTGIAPGLHLGQVPGNIDVTAPNPENMPTDALGPSMSEITAKPPWADQTTFVYTAQFYDEDGVVSFYEDIDDMVWLKVDGQVALDDGDWQTPTASGTLNLTPGWVDFELRMSNGTGLAGVVGTLGFGFDPTGAATLPDASLYTHPQNPGLFQITARDAINMGTHTFKVTGDSTLLAKTDSTASFGDLTLENGTATIMSGGNDVRFTSTTVDAATQSGLNLMTNTSPGPLTMKAGALGTAGLPITFDSTAIDENATAVGFDVETATELNVLTGGGAGPAATITKSGSHELVLDKVNSNLQNATFEVAEGTLKVSGTTPLGGATALTLSGGMFSVADALGAPGSGAAPANPAAHWAFDELAGATEAVDSSPSGGHTGTINGALVEQPGMIGTAYSFDGVDDTVDIVGYKGIGGDDPRTLTAWVKTTADDASFLAWGEDATGEKWNFRVQTGNGQAGAIRVEISTGYIVGDTDIRDDQWHHVAAVLPDGVTDATQMRLYVDGRRELVSASNATPINTDIINGIDVVIGNDHANRYFSGNMDDVFIYDRALSGADVVGMYSTRGVPPDMSAVKVTVTADSTLLSDSSSAVAFSDLTLNDGTLTVTGIAPISFPSTTVDTTMATAGLNRQVETSFGPLTMKAGVLATSGLPIAFDSTSIPATASAVGFDPQTDTDLGVITGGGVDHVVTISKVGTGELVLDKTNQDLDDATFEVQAGRLEMIGSGAWGGASKATLAGGTMYLEGDAGVPDVPEGAIAHYPFDNKYVPATDDSGNGHTGALVGEPAFVAGKVGGALDYDGVDDGVNIVDGGSFLKDEFTQRTVSMWVKQEDPAGEQMIFDEGGKTNGLGMRLDAGKPGARIRDDSVSSDVLGIDAIDPGWHHLVAVFGENTFRLYLDTNPVGAAGTSFGSLRRHTNAPGIGYRNGENPFDTAGFFNGLIDEVYVYEDALGTAEIQKLFDAGSWVASHLDLASKELTLTANSSLELGTGATAAVGPLTLVDGILTVRGAPLGVTFNGTTLAPADVDLTTGINTDAYMEIGALTADGVTPVTFSKRGPGDIVMDEAGVALDAVTIDVTNGRLIGLPGSNPFGTATLQIGGANGELVLAAKETDTSPVAYENAVVVAANGTITAGSGGFGGDHPAGMTIQLGSPAHEVTLNDATTVALRSTGNYSLEVVGEVVGLGGIDVTEGSVTLSDADFGAATASGGALALSQAIQVGTLDMAGGAVIPNGNELAVTGALTLAASDLDMTGAPLVTAGADVSVGVGTTLTVDNQVLEAANLDLQGSLVRTGDTQDVTVTQSLSVGDASHLNMTGATLTTTGADVTVGQGAELTAANAIEGVNVSVAGTANLAGGEFTDLNVSGALNSTADVHVNTVQVPFGGTVDVGENRVVVGESLFVGGNTYSINPENTFAAGGTDLAAAADFTLSGGDFTVAGREAAPTDGLVGNWKFDETSGLVAVNSATPGDKDGTLTNFDNDPNQWVEGRFDGALDFDGANDRVQITGYNGIGGTNPRTISAWIKTTDNDAGIMGWGRNKAEKKWTFRVQDDNGTAGAIRVEVNGGYRVGSTPVWDDEWHHVACVFPEGATNVNQVLLYVDGQLEANSATKGKPVNTDTNSNVKIGVGQGNSLPLDGLIDEVLLYGRDLSAEEIGLLFGGGFGPGGEGLLDLSASNVLVTADTTITSANKPVVVFGNLAITNPQPPADPTTLILADAFYAFEDVTAEHEATIVGDFAASGTISPGSSVGTLNVDGEVEIVEATYLCEIQNGVGNDLIHNQDPDLGIILGDLDPDTGDLVAGATLDLKGIALGDPGTRELTLLSIGGAGEFEGDFMTKPTPDDPGTPDVDERDYLGYGLFFEGYNVSPNTYNVSVFQALPGDTDGDGDVDPTDLSKLVQNWEPAGTDKVWRQGNFDDYDDGNVDPSDLSALVQNWAPAGYPTAEGAPPVGGSAAVPEPGTMLLLGMGGLCLWLLWRRR